MPSDLKRFHESRQSHFITFSCYHRRPLLVPDSAKRTFLLALERVRRKYNLCVYGYVIMPEHVHLLLSEPEDANLAQAIKSLKQGVSRRLIGDNDEAFWLERYYDHNIRNYETFVEKLRYIHRNPLERGLCNAPEDWPWSSFRHYAMGEIGAVEIESQWTASRRERSGVNLMVRGASSPRSSENRA